MGRPSSFEASSNRLTEDFKQHILGGRGKYALPANKFMSFHARRRFPRRVFWCPMARPSKFKPEFIEQARKLCELGATDMEIADFFGVVPSTVYKWKNENPEFSEALKSGKEEADNRVERSLYHKAVGYTFPSVKIFNANGSPLRVKYREHVPPDTTAAIFWLKNRRPDEWRDKAEVDVNLKVGLAGRLADARKRVADYDGSSEEG